MTDPLKAAWEANREAQLKAAELDVCDTGYYDARQYAKKTLRAFKREIRRQQWRHFLDTIKHRLLDLGRLR